MNRQRQVVAARLFGMLLLCVAGIAGAAAGESMRIHAELRPAADLVGRGGLDPVVYNRYSVAAAVASNPTRPHLGTALDYAGGGPQMAISAVRVFLHSRSPQVHERIRVELKFWSAYSGSASPVFSSAPKAGLVAIEMVGPYILDADTLYGTIVELPEPVLVDAWAATGISMHVLVGAINEDPLVESSELLPGYDTGTAGAVGSVLETYADVDGTRGDHNFAPTDLLRDGVDPQKKLPLAITLYGKAQRMVQCGTWANYANHRVEEFDDPNPFYTDWELAANGGNASFRMDGSYVLQNTAAQGRFPFLRATGTPIPSSGEFSVRWRARYLSAAPSGTGSLVISRGLPTNGAGEPENSRAAWVWQDTSMGYTVNARTTAGPPPAPWHQEAPGAGTAVHDVEYCWLANTVELWVDGARVLNQPRNANLARPDSLWIGNPLDTGDPNGAWNAIQIYRVHVRVPFVERIFAHGFESATP